MRAVWAVLAFARSHRSTVVALPPWWEESRQSRRGARRLFGTCLRWKQWHGAATLFSRHAPRCLFLSCPASTVCVTHSAPPPPLPRPRTPPPTVVITPPHRPFSPSSLTSCDFSSSLDRSSMHPARVTTIVIVAIVVAIGGAGGLYYASQNGAAGRTQYNTKKSYSHSSSSSHSKRDDVSKRGAAAAAMRSFKGVSAGPARHYGTNGAVLSSPVLLLLLLTLPIVHLSPTSRPHHLSPPSSPFHTTLCSNPRFARGRRGPRAR